MIQLATLNDIPKLIPVLKVLRPTRTEEELAKLLEILFDEGYKLAFIGDDEIAFSAIGFRIQTFLYSGKTLYIDDLVTLENHRKKGYGKLLLDFAKNFAKDTNCETFSLDSGIMRKDAHRLYLNEGFDIDCLHFACKVDTFKI
jgi:GNAT superfamily N-acetyltransferase